MSRAGDTAPGASPRAGVASPTFVLLVGGVGAATAGALVVSGGSPAVTLAPMLLAALAYLGWTLPLRVSGAAVLFLGLALETSTDAGGLWHTPLARLGDLLRENLEQTLGLPGVRLAGVEVLLLGLLAVAAWRRARGSTIDTAGEVPASPLARDAVLVYLAAVLFTFAQGLATGGSFALWQLRRLVQVPLYFAFFQAAFRGPRDHRLVGGAIVAAACVKGVLAAVAQRISIARTGGELAHATNHGDSILFATAIIILVFHVLERPDRGRVLRAAVPLALLLLGIKENNRRIAFVELGMGLAAGVLLAPPRRWKRSLARAALVLAPVALLYVAAGWSSTDARVFGPVRKVRSLVDGETNRSTAWRDVENWNISRSMRDRPLLGIGLGKEYTEYRPNDDISYAYKEYRFWPHNFVLGLFLFGGVLGFTGMWSLFAFTVFLAARALPRASRPEDRVAALAVVGVVVCCAVQAYGDLGAAFTQFRLLEGLALAVAGRLAVATGGWPSPARAAGQTPPALAVGREAP